MKYNVGQRAWAAALCSLNGVWNMKYDVGQRVVVTSIGLAKGRIGIIDHIINDELIWVTFSDKDTKEMEEAVPGYVWRRSRFNCPIGRYFGANGLRPAPAESFGSEYSSELSVLGI